jgi:tetratricopeptide (TPR) repeat protein
VWVARALTIAEGLREPSTLAYCLSRVAVTQTQEASWTEADTHLARAIEISRDVGDQRTVEECRGIAAVGLYARGAFEESRRAWAEVFASARSRDDVQTECWSRAGQAQALVREGRAQEALSLLNEGMTRVDTHAASTELLWVHGVLSLAHLQVGDRSGARIAAERALEQMRASRPVVYYVAPALAAVTEVLCALAEVESGTAQTRLLAQARHAGGVLHGFAMMFAFAGASDLWLSGTRRKLEGRHESAIATWRKALAIAQTLGTRYEEARLHVLLARYDGSVDSRGEVAQATKIFEALGASHDLGVLRTGVEQAGSP